MPSFLNRLNPIIIREMRTRFRGRRLYIVMIAEVLLLSLLAGLIYTTIYYDYASRTYYNLQYASATIALTQAGPEIGKALFAGTILLLLTIFSFIAPAFGAGAIAGEHERQTYDTLRLTALPTGQIVAGKTGSAFVLMLLFILASYPIQIVAYLFGGIELTEIIIASIGLFVTAWGLSTLGIFISTFVKRTTIAVSIAYGIVIPVIYLFPIIIIIFLENGPLDPLLNNLNTFFEIILDYFLYFFFSLNPFFAAILTSEAASQGNGYLFFRDSSFGPINNYYGQLWFVSPWLIYTVFYSFTTLILYILTIRRLNRISRS